ncbi:hypothetical protein PR202_ga13286 [Eleusine coracana subsp. coracana]|uniref:Uncharacterized protein n=1 Tax=Eleusine coracana subsp. coracana TaxID=191504 RepID=A0AAV5CEB1_ELECO|nr:hypothetical protein PR202_ga13286 [Eleusine coracana subsp. coracana]
MATVTRKEGGVTKAAVCGPEEDCAKKAACAPEDAVLPAPEKEPQGLCYKKTVGEEATFLETAKDYFTQFKDTPAKTHWICITNRVRAAGEYVSQKSSSVKPLAPRTLLLPALFRSLFGDARCVV